MSAAPTIAAAHSMGAKGAQSYDDAERLAFEAWMRGHCWKLCAVWEDGGYRGTAEHGENICPRAMNTRQLWAAWRDRASLAAQPKPAPVLLTDEELIDVIDSAPTGWRERYRAIEAAVLRKQGIEP